MIHELTLKNHVKHWEYATAGIIKRRKEINPKIVNALCI
jgi:hypothetical protein